MRIKEHDLLARPLPASIDDQPVFNVWERLVRAAVAARKDTFHISIDDFYAVEGESLSDTIAHLDTLQNLAWIDRKQAVEGENDLWLIRLLPEPKPVETFAHAST